MHTEQMDTNHPIIPIPNNNYNPNMSMFNQTNLPNTNNGNISASPLISNSTIMHSPGSSNSSIMSSQGSSFSENSILSYEFNPLRYRNDMNKSFEDDLIFCPRSLLSVSELKRCEELDRFMFNKALEFNKNNNIASINLHPSNSNNHNNNNTSPLSSGIKFNPYTSASFNPTNQ